MVAASCLACTQADQSYILAGVPRLFRQLFSIALIRAGRTLALFNIWMKLLLLIK